jgi:hypothetical protein
VRLLRAGGPKSSDEMPSFGVRLNLRVESGYELCAKLSKRNGTASDGYRRNDPDAKARIGSAGDAFGCRGKRAWRGAASRTLSNGRRSGVTISNFSSNPFAGHGDRPDLDPVSRNGAGDSMASPSVFGWNGPPSDSLAAVAGRRWRIALRDGPIPIARAARPASAAATQPPTPLSAGRRISSKATRGAEKINLGALCNVLRQFHFHVVASPTIRTGPGLPPERVIPSLSSSGFQFLGSLMIRRTLMLPFGSQRSLPVVKGNGFFRAHFSAA